MTREDRLRGNLAALAATLLWASSFPATEVLLADWHPLPLAAARLVLGSLTMLGLAAGLRQLPACGVVPWRQVALIGCVGSAGSVLCLITGQVLSDPVTAATIVTTQPLVAGVTGHVAGREELAVPCPGLGPGRSRHAVSLPGMTCRLFALRASLVRDRERRPLARAAGLLWPGIDTFDGRRFCGSPPANLDRAASTGIELDTQGVAIRADETMLVAELVFARADGRVERLTFPRPGITVQLVSRL